MKPLRTTTLLDIIAGRRRGVLASTARIVFGMATPFYRFGVWWRNRRFDGDPSSVIRVQAPVISIGNITTGGTGKTPMVIFVAKFLRSRGLRTVIISRGYGQIENNSTTRAGQTDVALRNDEALELEHRLPGVPHLQSPDRVRIATRAINEFDARVILMDDGFQHRRLARDLDIVLIDALEPFGFGRLLPRGLLREPVSSLQRADAIIVTRADAAGDEVRSRLSANLKAIAPNAVHAVARTVSSGWMQFDDVCSKDGRPGSGDTVFAFCAIGNPDAFRHSIEATGVRLAGLTVFPDHHVLTMAEFEQIARDALEQNATAIVCTYKDLVKARVNRIALLPLFALMIETEFVSGGEELDELIASLVDRSMN